MTIANGGAGYGGENDDGDDTGDDYLRKIENRKCGIENFHRGFGIIYSLSSGFPAFVGVRRIMGFHVHAAGEARHVGQRDPGGMVMAEYEIVI